MTKHARALELRDMALVVLKARGEWVPVRKGGMLRLYRDDDWVIAHRTPFQKIPGKAPESAKYLAAQRGRGSVGNLPYGLDLWHNAKVLNVEWSDDDGRVDVVTYKPGEWEIYLAALAASLKSPPDE